MIRYALVGLGFVSTLFIGYAVGLPVEVAILIAILSAGSVAIAVRNGVLSKDLIEVGIPCVAAIILIVAGFFLAPTKILVAGVAIIGALLLTYIVLYLSTGR